MRRSSSGIVVVLLGLSLAIPSLGMALGSDSLSSNGLDTTDNQVASTATPVTVSAAARPDIVFLLVDDLAQMDNRIWQQLPTINRLFLQQGVTFSDYVGNDPLCCPGRANLLSGLWSHHHGVTENDARLFDPRETIATELKSVGYWTGIFGKYFNQTNLLADKSPVGWDQSFIFSGTYFNLTAYNNGATQSYGNATKDYSTRQVASHAIAALKSAVIHAPNKPRFVWLSPYSVHAGKNQAGVESGPAPDPRDIGDPRCAKVAAWSTAANTEADMSDKPAYLRPRAMISTWPLVHTCETLLSTDRMLAQVLAEFKAEGRPEPMVILTVDNGMDFGAHHWATKFVPYATPIPMFVHWPAVIGATPRIDSTTITNVDVAPTLCAIAGCVMGPYPAHTTRLGTFPARASGDGISFLPLLLTPGATLGRTAVFEEHPSAVDGSNMPPWNGVRTTAASPLGRWVYTVYQTGEKELYDISGGPCWTWHTGMPGDPCELTNLAGQAAYASVQAQLATLLANRESHPELLHSSPPIPASRRLI